MSGIRMNALNRRTRNWFGVLVQQPGGLPSTDHDCRGKRRNILEDWK